MRFVSTKVILVLSVVISLSFGGICSEITLKKQQLNGVEIAWAEAGDPTGPPILMIHGLMVSHDMWPDPFIEGLVENGYRVIVFDNRDVGQSQRLDHHGNPVIWWNLLKAKIGLAVTAPYTLYDMADDAVALLDVLNIKDAHIMGASMGGMIAQIIAAKNPERARSLISIMSTTSAPHLPKASEKSSSTMEGLLDPTPERRKELNEIGMYPSALPRQFMAILSTGDRSNLVSTITANTLVIHGKDDTLLPIAHGEHTAELIAGSEFIAVDGMGHDMKDKATQIVLKAIKKHIVEVETFGMAISE
jgi:pimeloyl-ACP methyl ester carboxylesterase